MVARFLAGGTLIALNELKDGSPPPDIRPIAVGESLWRLTHWKMHLCPGQGQSF